MQGVAQHICYYSNKCQWSRAFIEQIADTPWKREFRFVCVDPSPDRPSLPKWLQKVPTLMIQGEQTPRTDNDVMNWLYERKQKETKNSMGMGMSSSEPEAFLQNEMGEAQGYQYSFVDADTTPDGNGGATIPGNFAFLNGGSAPGDRSAQQIGDIRSGESGNAGRSKKELMFDKQMEAYQRERDAALARPVKRV